MKLIKWIFFVTVVALLACSRNMISVTETSLKDEIATQQNVVFKFNKDLVPDSLINTWDTSVYVQFIPEVRGYFKWTSRNELTFSPVEGFAPNTDYKALLLPSLNKYLKDKKSVSTEPMVFHTPYLKIEATNAYWTISEDGLNNLAIRMGIIFNFPVNTWELNKYLKLKTTQKELNYKIITNGTASTVEVEFVAPDPESAQGFPVQIEIDKGLSCQGSNRATSEAMTVTAAIPSREKLEVIQMLPGYDEEKSFIRIYFNQPVKDQNLKDFISLEPAVQFTAETDQNDVTLSGTFEEGKTYEVILKGSLNGVFNKSLGNDYSQKVTFKKADPYLGFQDQNSYYMTTLGNRNLGINIIDVPTVKVSVFKIFENNIIHYLRGGKDYDSYYEEDEFQQNEDGDYVDHGAYLYSFNENYGKLIYSKEVNTEALPKNGNLRLLNLKPEDLDMSGALKGFLLVRIESTEKKWLRDVALVSLSDIGLICKASEDQIWVMANSIRTTKALAGVKVNFITSNNQTLQSAVTNAQGVAVFDNVKKYASGFNMAMITARSGSDFNFVYFNQTQVETSRFDLGGKTLQNIDYDVFIYGPRNLYRPGDSVYINTIVRTRKWNVVPNLPLKVKLIQPNGKELFVRKLNTNNEGAVEFHCVVPPKYMTGQYTYEVYSANDVLLNSYNLMIEEFMPDRIKVQVSLDKKEYAPGEVAKVNLQATNFFGPPAANRNVESELLFRYKTFQPKNFKDWTFDPTFTEEPDLGGITNEGKTNEKGVYTDELELPDIRGIGQWQGRLFSTVFDENGRPVNRLSTFVLNTQRIFYGIRNFDGWVSTRRPITMQFAALDKNGNPVKNAKTRVQIIRYHYENIIQRSGTDFTYNSQRKEFTMLSKEFTFAGEPVSLTYTPVQSGNYEVRIFNNESGYYVKQDFYAYGYNDTYFTSFEVSKDGEIMIESDKDVYSVGETANLLFKCPFSGKLVVTVERENVQEYYVLDAQNKTANLNLPIKEGHLPNIFISATILRQMDDVQLPLTVAHGYVSLKTEQKSDHLTLTLSAPEKVNSRTRQTVTVQSAPNTQYTIAVVDEGILQIKNYKTPDPYDFFYQKRALEVNSYDLYAYLYPEIAARKSSTGGDGGFDLERRINPLTNKRVKLISLWSGILKSNGNGKASFTFDIPQFSGSLRVMAVAWNGRRFGNAEKQIQVADPIVISTALPRFLSPGDNAKVPVMLSNTTEKPLSAKLTFTTNGPVKLKEKNVVTVNIPANREIQLPFTVSALNDIGEAKITVTVEAENKTYMDVTDVTVRPIAGLSKISGSGSIDANSEKGFTITNDYIASTSRAKLIISKSPMIEYGRQLTDLLNYPYGCLEQTVSTAFPLLYYRDIAKVIKQNNTGNYYNPNYLVQQAIQKVQGLQDYNGSFEIWPNYSDGNWWASAYATHFLVECKNAGYEVNKNQLENALLYLLREARKKETAEYYCWNEKGQLSTVRTDREEIFYSLYILSLAGKPNVSLMNHYKMNNSLTTTDQKFMLACAFALAGDKNSYRNIVPANFATRNYISRYSSSYTSALRNKALVLSTLMDADPSSPEIPVLAKSISTELKSKYWTSTQEKAFSLLAFGKMSRKANAANVKAQITSGQKQIASFDNQNLVITQNIQNTLLKIKTSGNGMLYYYYEAEGVSKSGKIPERDENLEVRKQFYNRWGKPVDLKNVKQNDLLVVKVTLKSTNQYSVPNIVITDMLPACFEIDNPRLSNEREYSWIKDPANADYTDIRDDRILYFTSAYYTEKSFYYQVRVVSKGEYQMGPVSAESMYDGSCMSASGSRVVGVSK
jgi:alpha-2-macroglobulin